MMIMVAGGSGLLGHHVVQQARSRGHKVAVMARTRRPGVDHAVDLTTVTQASLAELLVGYDAVVFAGGVLDEGSESVEDRLRSGYVDPAVTLVRAARSAGCTRAVLLGSYYVHFQRTHPEWRLARHPYVRARLSQANEAREVAGAEMSLATIQIPYVFGVAPGRVPEWSNFWVKWLRSPIPMVVPSGGTAVTSVKAVADAAVTALEERSDADIPVAEENLSWKDMVLRMAAASGRSRAVREVPTPVLRRMAQFGGAVAKLTRAPEQLMDIGHLDDVYTHEMYLEITAPRSLDAEIAETVKAER